MIRRAQIVHLLGRLDYTFVVALLLLTLIGVLFIFSASSRNEEDALSEMTRKQVVWVVVGTLLFLSAVAADYRKLADSAWWLFGISLLLLGLVFFIGTSKYGASRWLNLFGLQVQPSEFAKLSTLILLAAFLSEPSRDTASVKCLAQVLLIVALPFGLIMEQPDLGTAMTLAPLTFAMLFAGGARIKHLAVLVLVALLAMPVAWLTLADYQKNRILVFLDPSRDPLDAGWNTVQSAIAVGSGGLMGKGYLKGTQNVLGFLPRTVAPTDFIFSVIAEEMGFAGSVVLLSLFTILVWGGLRSALRSRDKFGRLLATGVVTLVFFHMFVNMAMTIGLMPITGIPLPLVSYGGSFMVCTMIGLGIVQSVYVRRLRR
jgi:rod shape determining protein RodA